MIIENLSTLKIHKLTQKQYAKALAAGNIDEKAMYLTPEEPLAHTEYVIILPETTFTFTQDDINDGIVISEKPNLEIGKKYIVNYNGIEYECECYSGEYDFKFLGNDSYASSIIEDRFDGEPFLFIVSDTFNTNIIVNVAGSHSFSIIEEVVHKIDKKYLPDINPLPAVTTDDNGAFLRVVNGEWAVSIVPNAEEVPF